MWGIDTATDYRDVIGPVKNMFGVTPDFVGRYIGEYVINREERSFILEGGTRLFLIENRVTGSSVLGSFYQGSTLAKETIKYVRYMLGDCPPMVPIFLDIEQTWEPSAAFLAGWFGTVWNNIYAPGIYFPATNPSVYDTVMSVVKHLPFDVWLWSSEPELYSWKDTRRATVDVPVPVDIHQYWENSINGLVDLDACTTQMYQSMWSAPEPVSIHHPTQSIGLKPTPAHGGKNTLMLGPHANVEFTGRRYREWVYVEAANLPGWVLGAQLQPKL